METTILLVALVVSAFAISRVITRYASRYFVVSGVEYIILGLLLGPITGVLGPSAFEALELLIAMLLGLLGMMVGLRARSAFRPARGAVAAVLASGIVLVGVAALSLPLIEYFLGGQGPTILELPGIARVMLVDADPDNVRIAATLGCCACVSSPVMVHQSAQLLKADGPNLRRLEQHGVVSQILALGAFGIVAASARATESADYLHIPVLMWAASIALFGAISGLLFSRFIGTDANENRVLVSAVGVVTFASGVGVALGVSPLVVNLIAGIFVSLMSPDAPALWRTMVRLRHPILVLVRVFAGAAWVAMTGWLLVLVPLYAGVRIGLRRLTTFSLTRLFDRTTPRLPRLGYGLVGQGGLAAAIALSFATDLSTQGGVVLTTVLGGLVLSDLLGHRAIRRVLADAGELDARREQEGDTGDEPDVAEDGHG